MSEREAQCMWCRYGDNPELVVLPREKVEALVTALRDIASVDRDFVEANGGAEDAIDKIIGHASAALDALEEGKMSERNEAAPTPADYGCACSACRPKVRHDAIPDTTSRERVEALEGALLQAKVYEDDGNWTLVLGFYGDCAKTIRATLEALKGDDG
jgi:hypothetical protein